MSLSPKTV